MENNTNFQIRGYGRTELALLYAPEDVPKTAYKKMQRWIIRHPHLSEQLAKAGLSPRSRIHTPLQVRIIVEALGEP